MGLFNFLSKKSYSLEYWDQYMNIISLDDGKILKNLNSKPNSSDSLIHRYPYNLENKKGQKTRHIMQSMIVGLRKKSGLSSIYGGYVLVTPKIIESDEWGSMFPTVAAGLSVLGQDQEFFEKEVRLGNKHCLAYYGVPKDDTDFLIERPSWDIWDFKEIVDEFHGIDTIATGDYLSLGREGGTLRTFRFSFDLDGWTA
jgi:hypothetical protein